MIRRAKEGETTWIPGLGTDDLPSLPSGITIHIRRGQVGIEPQGIVGALPLLNGDTLQITPKVGRANFFRMLFKAEGFQRDLEREFASFVSYSVDDEQNLDTIVARGLLTSTAEILSRSAQQGRIKKRHVGSFASGQIEVLPTLLNTEARRADPVVYILKERTIDIAENRVLTEAIKRAWAVLDSDEKSKFLPVHIRWIRNFPGSFDLHDDLRTVEQGFASGRYGGARDYYRHALMLALVMLGGRGLGFSESAMITADAVLLNTADIFEKYLRNVLAAAYSNKGYTIVKGGLGAKTLYDDGSFELVPDITISKSAETLLIADAKYKEPTSGDHYQMQTYLSVFGISRGIILAPLLKGEEVIVREYASRAKIIVREVYLPLNNLPKTEQFLSTMVERYA